MKVRFALRTAFLFSEPVTGHVFRIRPVPPELPGQHVLETKLTTQPALKLSATTDPVFGNLTLTGRIDAPHESFEIKVEGVLEREEPMPASAIQSGCSSLIGFAADPVCGSGDMKSSTAQFPPQPYFLYPTALTQPGPRVLALWESVSSDALKIQDAGLRSLFLMHAAHRALTYKKGATSVGTSAEEALSIGSGVCQDYSHVLICLLRLAGIPALYAAGLVAGEGPTHAWVQAWCGSRWLSLDPTHDAPAQGAYVTLARGCDFADAALERGIFLGSARQTIETSAEVKAL